MASSEQDEALQYLLSKLQSDDGWSCANLAWNKDRLTVIADQFSNFDGGVKSKLLLSFLAMSPRVIASCRDEMFKLLRLARRDSDEWVRLLASVLGSFPSDQLITLDDDSTASDILTELSDTISSVNGSYSCPQELSYLSSTVLNEYINYAPTTSNHFNLRQRPKTSSQLRTDVLHRAEIDFAQAGSLIRDRILQRQPSTGSKSFVSLPQRLSSSVPIKTGLMQRRHRQKGTKLLEIDEVPLAGRRKRKSSVLDVDTPTNKKLATPTGASPLVAMVTPPLAEATPTEGGAPTPDYAAALTNDDTSIQPHLSSYSGGFFPNTPLSAKSLSSPLKSPDKPKIKPVSVSMATVAKTPASAESSFSAEVIQSILTNTSLQTTPTEPHPSAAAQQQSLLEERQRLLQQMTTPTQTTNSIAQPVAKQPTNRLKLSRQQLAVAQEIFREAPHLNKQQKALILAFMAGSRDNPLPGHDVISLKLNQRQQQEFTTSSEGEKTLRTVQLETIFEMNYNTGQWRKLQVKRPLTS